MLVTGMFIIRTNIVISWVPESMSGAIESRVTVMFEGKDVRATFMLHQHELRPRLLIRPSQV